MNRTSSITAVLMVFLTAASSLQVTSYGQQKSESSRKASTSPVSDTIDWDRIYEEALESNAGIRRKVEQGETSKVEVIEWLKLVRDKAGKEDHGGSGHNFPATAYEYAKLIEPQLGVPPRVDLNKAVEIPLFVNGKRAYGNLGTACDNRTYLGKATVSGSTLQRHVGRTAEGESMPDVIWISFGRNSTVDFEKIDGSVQMIGYNKKTGATAFFESNGSNLRPWISLDEKTWRMRGVMPWIDDPDEFNRAFVTPGRVQCVECHQADPFITNDFINAAKLPGTDESVVPALDKDSPYYVIGGENWDMRTVHLEGNACFECHRVGMSTMSLFMRNDWDPNQHMPPDDPGSLEEDLDELIAAWKSGPENTPGAEWIIPPAGSAPRRIVGGDYPHKAGFNKPDRKALGRRNQKPRMIAEPEWTQSYKAGSPDTAWVYKTSIENALRKDAPRPVRLTPEQSKAQLAALRQPYLFEYRDKPAFTIQIPGEFARGNATGGNVFHAKKAFNTLSISISQAEDPEQAARRYVEALKQAGNGTAEMVKQSETKLPDGTPAVEFVATWVTKQNAKQTTQALTACKDGHAVTVATHTWEVSPPSKRFFFTLKFEDQQSLSSKEDN